MADRCIGWISLWQLAIVKEVRLLRGSMAGRAKPLAEHHAVIEPISVLVFTHNGRQFLIGLWLMWITLHAK